MNCDRGSRCQNPAHTGAGGVQLERSTNRLRPIPGVSEKCWVFPFPFHVGADYSF